MQKGLTGYAAGAACLAALAIGGWSATARAAEVVVQNDNLVDFQSAAIVGDFVAGEQAGVRLTSPCDGDIVAVQILWWEGVPGNPDSLEESIWIRADGAFPVPGPVLLELVAPVLTPQFLNEFRHVDEAGTIPISVPVTNGQSFFVSLEFANPTNVGGGSASVVRDLSGCQANSNVLFAIPGGWLDFCTFLSGDLVIRAVVDCTEPMGACCDAEASCLNDIDESDCQDAGETFFVGQTCGQVTCPAPTGACCNGAGGCLDGQTQDFCENVLSSIYAGNGALCADQVCELGACCLPLGSCQDVVDAACTTLGGIFEGPGTTCAGTSCPQPLGACCIGTACVNSQTETNCVGFPGTWQGPFTDCGPPDPCTACNDGDADQDGDVDLEDFAAFHQCHGAAAIGPCECLDMDNDSDIDNADLIAFTSALTGP